MTPRVTILIPAHNEAAYIKPCLDGVLASDAVLAELTVIVVANACTDDTAQLAQSYDAAFTARGWRLTVIDTPVPGKLHALNIGEAERPADICIYLDADVVVSPPLIAQLVSVLKSDRPVYAGGTPQVVHPSSRVLYAYTRFWTTLPFVAQGVPGFGVFGVNAAGRARWAAFPDIISDDTFVRLNFTPDERRQVPATYTWPMITSLGNLIRVRRRQNVGVSEIARDFPHLIANDEKPKPGIVGLARRFFGDPFGFAAYAGVSLAVRLPIARTDQRWARGR